MSNTTAGDANTPDGMIAENAVKQIQKLSANPDQPWFVGVGFHKPHLPHVAPSKYFDLYDVNNVSMPTPSQLPVGYDTQLWQQENGNHELFEYDDIIY